VFGIEIEVCVRCGGQLRIIASIEEPEIIAKILAHLERVAPDPYSAEWALGAREGQDCGRRGRNGEAVMGGKAVRPGSRAAAVAGLSLAAATAARTSGPLCEWNRAG
jgi:hypothetical protein